MFELIIFYRPNLVVGIEVSVPSVYVYDNLFYTSFVRFLVYIAYIEVDFDLHAGYILIFNIWPRSDILSA